MRSLESRITELEKQAPVGDVLLLRIIGTLPSLDERGELDWTHGNEVQRGLADILRRLGTERLRDLRFALTDPIDAVLAWVINRLHEEAAPHNPLALERFRGRVPDRVLTALYDHMRNRVMPADVALRVRQLAGVLDEHGKPLPGYTLAANGCIIDAEPTVPTSDDH